MTVGIIILLGGIFFAFAPLARSVCVVNTEYDRVVEREYWLGYLVGQKEIYVHFGKDRLTQLPELRQAADIGDDASHLSENEVLIFSRASNLFGWKKLEQVRMGLAYELYLDAEQESVDKMRKILRILDEESGAVVPTGYPVVP